MRTGIAACCLTTVALVPYPLLAQQRPDEATLFGASSSDASGEEAPVKPDEATLFGASSSDASGEEAPVPDEATLFGTQSGAAVPAPADVPMDPLRIGGQIYSRALVTFNDPLDEAHGGDAPYLEQTSLSTPTLVDLYFDARPNDRIRGLVVGRLQYSPEYAGLSTSSSSSSSETALSFGTAGQEVSVLLNQLWLSFDIGRTVFVTAGKQHVKWGTARFWNPTDFIQPVHRNPLEPFDVRTGVPMVKLHLPWEKRGWNLYALTLLDTEDPLEDPEPDTDDSSTSTTTYLPANPLTRVGQALRAEVVFGTFELGIDSVFRRDITPRLGVDFSAGIGPIDVYGEAAIGGDRQIWQEDDPEATDLTERYGLDMADTRVPRVSGGFNWQLMYNDNDSLILGAEYFYNPWGYADAAIYPWLILQDALSTQDDAESYSWYNTQQDFTPFYLGQHYGAAYAVLNSPGSWNDTSFTLSALANLSDQSYLFRLDYSVNVLTYLRIEAYGALHYGTKGGEFRLQLDSGDTTLYGYPLNVFVPAPLFDAGLSLRINI